MSDRLVLALDPPAGEMAREEIEKLVAFLSKDVSGVRFADGGASLEVDVSTARTPEFEARVRTLVTRVQRGLRGLRRNVVYRSPRIENPVFRGAGDGAGIHQLGRGQVALEGLPLALFRYFDRAFSEFGAPWQPTEVLTPTLIPVAALAKCDYFRSFPQNVTFACHLPEDPEAVESFRGRHQDRESLDGEALRQMETPEACLSPAVCYHVYHLNQGRTVPAAGASYAVAGKCFRYESRNLAGLRRLWDFTMREVVFLGGRDGVLRQREQGVELVARFLEAHALAGEVRTASDPFFIAPDAVAKAYFQLSSETKYEIALPLPDGGRLAVGSLNYHTDFFGRAFNIQAEGAGFMHSVCIAFGLERWVHAFLAQHGEDVREWPEIVRRAPEFARHQTA